MLVAYAGACPGIHESLAEFIAPSPHCLIGDDNATLSQKQLDVTQAAAEQVIQPHSLANDCGREAGGGSADPPASAARQGCRSDGHPSLLAFCGRVASTGRAGCPQPAASAEDEGSLATTC